VCGYTSSLPQGESVCVSIHQRKYVSFENLVRARGKNILRTKESARACERGKERKRERGNERMGEDRVSVRARARESKLWTTAAA